MYHTGVVFSEDTCTDFKCNDTCFSIDQPGAKLVTQPKQTESPNLVAVGVGVIF